MSRHHASTGSILNFIVPIRHPGSVRDPTRQQQMLSDLLASLRAQTDPRLLCHVVVNPEQILPPLPTFARRIEIDLPPNTALEGATTREEIYDAIRLDKGRRVQAAIQALSPDDLVMVVDDDDLLSRRLVDFVQSQRTRNQAPEAWVIDKGYYWHDGEDTLHAVDQFHRMCGSCLIIPARRYKFFHLETDATDAARLEAVVELGSHRLLVDADLCAGRRFGRLPFRAAIYRIGHPNASQVLVKAMAEARSGSTARLPMSEWFRQTPHRLKRLLRLRRTSLLDNPVVHRDRPLPLALYRHEFFGVDESAPGSSGAPTYRSQLPAQ